MNITVAVIGCGRIANAAHFPALSKIDGVRVKYACDLIEAKAVEAQKKFPIIENVTTDYHEVLADKEVEAVFVLTPNYAHYTVTIDALRAGKHVMCEKPITVNYALSKEMADEAEKQNKILDIGVCNRYNEAVVRLAEMNKRGELGNVYHVVCSFRRCRSIPGLGGAFTDKKQSGGGVLIDWGIHFLDLALYILGSPKLKTVTCNAYCEIAKDMKSYKYDYMWAEDTKDVENGVNDVDDMISGYVRTNPTITPPSTTIIAIALCIPLKSILESNFMATATIIMAPAMPISVFATDEKSFSIVLPVASYFVVFLPNMSASVSIPPTATAIAPKLNIALSH